MPSLGRLSFLARISPDCRITSYNVCYTKLLRKGKGYEPAEKDPIGYHGVPKFNPEEDCLPKAANATPTFVITSYSIHYTKLYDALVRMNHENDFVVTHEMLLTGY